MTIGAAEVPSALDRGVVDGVFTASSGGGKIWRDLLKYNYRLGPNFFDGVIAVNKMAFDKLPPEAQAKLKKIRRRDGAVDHGGAQDGRRTTRPRCSPRAASPWRRQGG